MSWASSKIWQIIGFVTFFTLLSISMVKIEAFELLFEFTRSNESWDLDEYISVFLAALVTGVFWFAVDAHKKGDELKRINEKNLSTERRLSDARRVQALGTLAGGVAHSGNNLMQPILTLARISKGQLPDDHAVQCRVIWTGSSPQHTTPVNFFIRFYGSAEKRTCWPKISTSQH